MYRVTLRFYEELNDLLPRDRRQREYAVEFPQPRSVKDLIEAQGVPHTEVDLILANGASVGFDYAVRDGDRLSVYPMFERFDVRRVSRLGRPPLRQPRFVADLHLGKLARRLRLLGLDCRYGPDWDDAALARVSQAEHRILLTRDRGLLKRRAVTHGLCVHATDAEAQAREVVQRCQLEADLRPFTRCIACNGPLVPAPKAAAAGQVPPETFAHQTEFHRCADCGRFYWRGAHWARLERLVASLTAPASIPLHSSAKSTTSG